uniref:uncharacterized protein LOC120337125 n=1 Tax=Styela clava TaxID=7725 RepID=UPI00193A9157|nr:uncharacterized protein LOC120337125 [Styela clava]
MPNFVRIGPPVLWEMDLKIDMKGPHAGGVEESEGYINPLGFQMKIGTCGVRFPRNTVEKPTFFQVLATNNPENEPEEYFAITPRIACNPSTVFNAPMAVKLPTWCGTDSGDVIASIMYKDEESGGPCNVLEHKLLRDYRKKIAFQSLYHTYFWVAIDEASLDNVYFSSHVSLYHNNYGNFKAVLYTGGTPDVNAELEKEGFSLIAIDFETQKIFLNDKLKFRVSGDSKFEGFFPLGKDFAKKRRSALEFKLSSPSHSIRKLKIILQLSEDNPIKANLLWTKQGPQLQISQEIETSQHDAPETGYSDVSALEGLSFKNSIEMQLGQQGGQISLDGNTIVFPPSALEQETKVTLSVDIDSENWNSEYIFISTILGCDLSGAALSKPALVKIETWCTAEEEDVLILKKDDDNSEWKVEKTAKLGPSGFITFKTKTFSLWGIVKSVSRRIFNIDYRFINLVYCNASATFNSVVCRQNETIINAVRERLESNTFEMVNVLPFQPNFKIPSSAEIVSITIKCSEPGESKFDSGDSTRNPISLDYSVNQVRQKYFEKTFVLTPKPKADCLHLKLRYKVIGVRGEIDNTFRFDWTRVKQHQNPDSSRTQNPGPTNTGNQYNYYTGCDIGQQQINLQQN